MDISMLLALIQSAKRDEKKIKKLKHRLKATYADLVPNCPHNEAVDYKFKNRGDRHRICITCGLEDMGSYGGTPGDEYNYGYSGHPDPTFWKGTKVKTIESEKDFFKWRHTHDHNWVVLDGKAVDRWA